MPMESSPLHSSSSPLPTPTAHKLHDTPLFKQSKRAWTQPLLHHSKASQLISTPKSGSTLQQWQNIRTLAFSDALTNFKLRHRETIFLHVPSNAANWSPKLKNRLALELGPNFLIIANEVNFRAQSAAKTSPNTPAKTANLSRSQ